MIGSTTDARLFAIDAATGELCRGFGQAGFVDLKGGHGNVDHESYFQTSAPLIAGHRVIVGGLVRDNVATMMPSGVIRAFDVVSGALLWAWDPGDPAITALPPQGRTYTSGAPNMWSMASFDEKLGLVYVPLGAPVGATDFWGGWRTANLEKYANSVVALDAATGRPRWHFQTIHHDIWDYDLPPQPTLFDVPDGKGGRAPALIQATKRGQIFLLDRRDGTPIAPVVEKPVPQGAQPDERLAPTQPLLRRHARARHGTAERSAHVGPDDVRSNVVPDSVQAHSLPGGVHARPGGADLAHLSKLARRNELGWRLGG